MRFVSPIIQRLVYPVLGKTGYFHLRSSAAVVTYHGVRPARYKSTDSFLDNTLVSLEAFRSQLRTLKRHYKVISPEHFLRWLKGDAELPQRGVLLTCDDGLLNNLTVMLPALQDEGLQCLFFVTGNSAESAPGLLWYIELYLMLMDASEDGPFECCAIRAEIPADRSKRRAEWLRLMRELSRLEPDQRTQFLREAARSWRPGNNWKQRIMDDPAFRERFQLMSVCDLKRIVDAGMTIGSHTMSHPVLSKQSDVSARSEMLTSRQNLTQCTGQEVWALAYPFGDPGSVGVREMLFAEEAGYECAFVNVTGSLNLDNKFSLSRVHVTSDMSLHTFEAHISGFHGLLQQTGRVMSRHGNGRAKATP